MRPRRSPTGGTGAIAAGLIAATRTSPISSGSSSGPILGRRWSAERRRESRRAGLRGSRTVSPGSRRWEAEIYVLRTHARGRPRRLRRAAADAGPRRDRGLARRHRRQLRQGRRRLAAAGRTARLRKVGDRQLDDDGARRLAALVADPADAPLRVRAEGRAGVAAAPDRRVRNLGVQGLDDGVDDAA